MQAAQQVTLDTKSLLDTIDLFFSVVRIIAALSLMVSLTRGTPLLILKIETLATYIPDKAI